MGTPRWSWVVLCAVLLFPSMVVAADLTVTPAVIDKEGKPRDIIKGELIVKNTTNHKISIFPDVKDFSSDAKGSMKSWLELSRGAIELNAGEERSVPYLLHINYDAKPGYYHAVAWFGTGSFRGEAESHPERATEVLVNVKVLDDAIERLQLATFVPDRQIFPNETADFSFGLQNTGNRLVAPAGNLRIFDRRGREIAVVPVNTGHTSIAPESKQLLAATWNADGKFGRYKAVLDVEYGGLSKQITDTTYFWVLPWGKTLSLFTGLSVAIVVISILLHSRGQARNFAGAPTPFLRSRKEGEFHDSPLENPAEPKDAFLEKLRLRKEAREQKAQILEASTVRAASHHGPVHLAVGSDTPSRSNPPSATRLARIERPRETGNVVRLSRKSL